MNCTEIDIELLKARYCWKDKKGKMMTDWFTETKEGYTINDKGKIHYYNLLKNNMDFYAPPIHPYTYKCKTTNDGYVTINGQLCIKLTQTSWTVRNTTRLHKGMILD